MGPNALIDENLPVVVLATRDENDPASMTLYEKSVSNIKEVKARDGIVISIVTAGDHLAKEASDHIIELPSAPDLLSPMLEICAAPAAGVSHRGTAWLRRGTNRKESGEVGDRQNNCL